MWAFARFVVFCLVAAAVGLVAVSLPIGGKTPAEYVRDLFQTHFQDETPKGSPAPAARPRMTTPAERPTAARALRPTGAAPVPAADRPPADDPTDEDRAALEKLLDERIR